MATFEVDVSGKTYEVDAPDQNSAVAGAQRYHNDSQVSGPNLAGAAVEQMPIIGGLAPKIGAAFQAATQPLLGRGSDAPTYEQRYSEDLARHQARQEAFATENPIMNTAAGIAGGTLATLPIAMTGAGAGALGITGPSLGARIGAGLLSGGGIGAADAYTRGSDILQGAGFGAAGGAAAPLVASGIGAAARGIRGQLIPTPSIPQNTVRIGTQELPLTGSEAAGNFAGIQRERGAARGQASTPEQNVAQPFFQGRQEQFNQVTPDLQTQFSPTGNIEAATPREAGAVISQNLEQSANIAKSNVSQAYDAVRALPTVVPGDQLALVPRRIKADLTFSKDPVVINEKITPAADQMLQHLDTWGGQPQTGQPQNRANIFGPMGQANPASVTMQDIDLFRQQLGSIRDAASNPADQRATSRIMKAFDTQVNQIAPSPELAAARQAHAQYKQALFPQGPQDDAGKAIQQILGGRGRPPATPAEVSDILYGSPKGQSPRVVDRLANIWGTDSPQFTAIKQGYLSHILEAPQGAQPYGEQKLASRLTDALGKNGFELTNTIFTPPERQELAQLANYYRKITAPAGAVNMSGTSAPLLQKLGKLLPTAFSLGGAAVGHALGGPVGAITGLAAGMGKKAVAERLAARSLARSMYGVAAPGPAPQLSPLYLAPPVLAPQFNRTRNR